MPRRTFLVFLFLFSLAYGLPSSQPSSDEKEASVKANEFTFNSNYIKELITQRGWTCRDVVSYFLQRDLKYNPDIRAIISFNPEIFTRAQELDDYYEQYKRPYGELHCVPMIIKDNIDIKGIATTGGVDAYRYNVPLKNALVIDRLNASGAVFLGKANMAQLAVGAVYPSDQVGLCQNPFDFSRTCSSSSSGSGASISAGLAVISLGTDTGGSILGPANMNGVFGLRSPHNIQQLEGILPLYPDHDTVGPFAKHLDDLILSYAVMNNQLSIYDNVVQRPISPSSLKVKVITNFMSEFTTPDLEFVIDAEVKRVLDQSTRVVETMGVNVEKVTLTQDQLNTMGSLFKGVIEAHDMCFRGCIPYYHNTYLGDESRFPTSSMARTNFKMFYDALPKDNYWKVEIDGAGFDVNQLGDMTFTKSICENVCANYNSLRPNYVKFVTENILDETTDALFLPSITKLVPKHDEVTTQVVPPQQDNLLQFSIHTGMGFLIMPSGFTEATNESPDGLPMSTGLLFHGKNVDNAFKIAKLYERANSWVKLPKNTPLLTYKPKPVKSAASSSLLLSSFALVISSLVASLFNLY